MNEDNKLIKEGELESVSGGKWKTPRPDRGKGTNGVCPKCGRPIDGYGAYDIEAYGVQLCYICHDCQLVWMRQTTASQANNYQMVSYTWNADGKRSFLGSYHG